MSKPSTALVELALVAAVLALAPAVHAQSVATLREQAAAMNVRRMASYERVQRATNAARTVPDDSLVLHGAVVKFRASQLSARNRVDITRAFDAAAAELTSAFGEGGAQLLAGQTWLLSFGPPSRHGSSAELELVHPSARWATTLRFPLRSNSAESLVLSYTGTSLVRNLPAIDAWVGGALSVANAEQTHYFAYRQLVMHATEEGQRCARGVTSDCATPLGVSIGRSQLRFAVERNGPAVLQYLQNPPHDGATPTAALAAAVGASERDFLAAWHARVADTGQSRASGHPGMMLTSIGWCALCAVLASRRRPH